MRRNELLQQAAYITDGTYASMDWSGLRKSFQELTSAVRAFLDGESFAVRLRRLIDPPRHPRPVRVTIIDGGSSIHQQRVEQRSDRQKREAEWAESYRAVIGAKRTEVEALIAEILAGA